MAKYVLVAFDNDEDADAFAEMVPKSGGPLDHDNSGTRMFVRGIFKKPTQYCKCNPQSDKSVRGAKWGWWVCAKCAKPKQKHWQSPRNLLDKEGMKSREANLVLTVVEPSTPVT